MFLLGGLLATHCFAGQPETVPGRSAVGHQKPQKPPGQDKVNVSRAGSGTGTDYQQFSFLSSLPGGLIQELQRQDGKNGKTRQIGLARTLDHPIVVSLATAPADRWASLPDGWRVFHALVASDGARGLRLHFENVSLPGGARLLLYDPTRPDSGVVTLDSEALAGATDLWAGTIFADRVAVECQAPPEVSLGKVAFEIRELSHIYRLPTEQKLLKEGSCHNDASCYPDYASQANGVALFTYIVKGNSYFCSGCLLATTQHTPEEYFLTARHCIDNQGYASTLEFYWLFQTPECGGTAPLIMNVPRTSGGADLLATGSSDFSLLRLNKAAPPGVFFLGWTVDRPAPGDQVAGIHHPDGTFKRISFGTAIDSDAFFQGVQWSSGVTESGCSGSPLLNGNHQVIGQLGGGFNGPGSSCDNPTAPDEYGRFDVTYPSIKKWIDPSGGSGGPAPVAGSFYGLFYDQGTGPVPESSGAIVLTVTAKKKFTGKLQFQNANYSFSGELDLNGVAKFSIKRGKLSPLALQLQINTRDAADTLSGLISDGTWTAMVSADRTVFDGRKAASGQAGRYTVMVPDNGSGAIGGTGFGSAMVDKKGRLLFIGSLADGTKVVQTSYVSAGGRWPLYASLYAGQGFLFSWVGFAPSEAADLAGFATWNKPGTNGFSGVFNLTGSAYSRPGPKSSVLNFSDGTLTLSGGELSEPLQAQVRLGYGGHVSNASALRMNLGFSPVTGLLSGTVVNPATKRPIAFQGVALQKLNVAVGYFGGTNQSGRVVLQAMPQNQ